MRPMRIAIILAASMLLTAAAQTRPDPDIGVPLTLAQSRAARVSNIHYDLSFTIPAERQRPIAGRETVTFTLSDASEPLAIDFSPERSGGLLHWIEAGGTRIDVRQVNGHVIVPSA